MSDAQFLFFSTWRSSKYFQIWLHLFCGNCLRFSNFLYYHKLILFGLSILLIPLFLAPCIIFIVQIILPTWLTMRRTRQRLADILEFIIKENESIFFNRTLMISIKDIIKQKCSGIGEYLCYPSQTWVQMESSSGTQHYIFEPVTLKRPSPIVILIFFYDINYSRIYSKCIKPQYTTLNKIQSVPKQFVIEIPGQIDFNRKALFDMLVEDFHLIYSGIIIADVFYHSTTWNISTEYGGGSNTNKIPIPNPWRIQAKGKIICHIPITLYANDTSGNKSEWWNNHVSYCFTLSGPVEIAEPIVKDELATEGTIGFDDYLKKDGLIKQHSKPSFIHQSMSHLFFTVEWMNFHIIELKKRRITEKIRIIKKEEDDRKRIHNSFLTLKSFDGCKYIPVEVLHVILLGVVKYLWKDFMNGMNKGDITELPAQWAAFNPEGLHTPPIQPKYMGTHWNSLIGKEFRIMLMLDWIYVVTPNAKVHISCSQDDWNMVWLAEDIWLAFQALVCVVLGGSLRDPPAIDSPKPRFFFQISHWRNIMNPTVRLFEIQASEMNKKILRHNDFISSDLVPPACLQPRDFKFIMESFSSTKSIQTKSPIQDLTTSFKNYLILIALISGARLYYERKT
ncbi:uncharacterized protein VP01_66g13 [Puccinia sorghi]|uniref:Uncharacterized protein n=1 Tax=Puccinia sorghi TaxID=27349 RepID=A0A0L6UEY5_9BASI|nr:uncharacterized protein VP01_66g13 [Puccinia sorghi]